MFSVIAVSPPGGPPLGPLGFEGKVGLSCKVGEISIYF